jgi:hypothetical protein
MSEWLIFVPRVLRSKLTLFEEACHNLGLTTRHGSFTHQGFTGIFEFSTTHGKGILCETVDPDILSVAADKDPKYNALVKQLGKGMGRLFREYSELVAREQAMNFGGSITNRVENPDGSITLDIAV